MAVAIDPKTPKELIPSAMQVTRIFPVSAGTFTRAIWRMVAMPRCLTGNTKQLRMVKQNLARTMVQFVVGPPGILAVSAALVIIPCFRAIFLANARSLLSRTLCVCVLTYLSRPASDFMCLRVSSGL